MAGTEVYCKYTLIRFVSVNLKEIFGEGQSKHEV